MVALAGNLHTAAGQTHSTSLNTLGLSSSGPFHVGIENPLLQVTNSDLSRLGFSMASSGFLRCLPPEVAPSQAPGTPQRTQGSIVILLSPEVVRAPPGPGPAISDCFQCPPTPKPGVQRASSKRCLYMLIMGEPEPYCSPTPAHPPESIAVKGSSVLIGTQVPPKDHTTSCSPWQMEAPGHLVFVL